MSTDHPIITARAMFRHSSPFTYLLSYLVPKENRSLFATWYLYLRWVDDIVDNEADVSITNPFVESRVRILFGNQQFRCEDLDFRETALLESFARSSGEVESLRGYIGEMLKCIRHDAIRRGEIIRYEQLQDCFRREVGSYLSSIAFFCKLKNELHPPGFQAAIGAKLVHVARDLFDDLDSARYNISSEDLLAYKIDIVGNRRGVIDASIIRWVAAQCRIADRLLEEGMHEIRSINNGPYRRIVTLLILKYQSYVKELRRRGFRPESSLRIHPLVYVSASIRNSTVNRVSKDPAVHTAPGPFVKPSLQSVLHINLLLLRRGRSATRHLYRVLDNLPNSAPDLQRLVRRFRVAYLMGRVSFSSIAPTAAEREGMSHNAGLLYGYWAVSAIELDRLMDEQVIDSKETEHLAEKWLGVLNGIVTTDASTGHLHVSDPRSNLFVRLSNSFMEAVRRHCDLISVYDPALVRKSKAAFFAQASSLMKGQLTSLLQRDPSTRRDWNWYRSEIQNSKNVQFFLAPFQLWRIEERSNSCFARVEARFNLLNGTYLHYQLLDDIADQLEDSMQGVVGAPGALLFSQAALAREYLSLYEVPCRNSTAVAQELCRRVERSELLASEFYWSPLVDRYRHRFADLQQSPMSSSQVEILVRCALANSDEDMGIALNELACTRDSQGHEYVKSLTDGDGRTAHEVLLRSGTPARLLAAVGEAATIVELRSAIEGARGEAETVLLYVLERLIRHTHRAATTVVAGNTPKRSARVAPELTDG